ncbi:unnamed protein product [Closterium sp. NIES-54]
MRGSPRRDEDRTSTYGRERSRSPRNEHRAAVTALDLIGAAARGTNRNDDDHRAPIATTGARNSRPDERNQDGPRARSRPAGATVAAGAENRQGRNDDAPGSRVNHEVFLLCDRADRLSLFDLTSGASPAPPATADSTVRSQWATRDAAARLALHATLPLPLLRLAASCCRTCSLTFTLDSGASRSFFGDRTTLTPLSRPVAVSLADPSGGPVLASFSTVIPCPAAPSGTLSGLYLPSFSTNLVSGADLKDKGVDQFTPASQRVTHCTCARTGQHLATFTRRPGSSLYTLSTESPSVPASGQVAASGQVFAAASGSGPKFAPCSCRLLSHQTVLWHHRLSHPSLPRL